MNRTIVVMAGLAGFVSGCAELDEATKDDTGPIDDGVVPMLEGCTPSENLVDDPLTESAHLAPDGLIHIVDVVQADSGKVFATGVGGLMTFDTADDGLALIGHATGPGTKGNAIEMLEGDRLALSSDRGFRIYDMSDPATPRAIGGALIGMSRVWHGMVKAFSCCPWMDSCPSINRLAVVRSHRWANWMVLNLHPRPSLWGNGPISRIIFPNPCG